MDQQNFDKMPNSFDPENHVFNSLVFESVVNEAIEFFISLSETSLPPVEKFVGPGIYAIYYFGPFQPYSKISQKNKKGYQSLPIYVGKAVPRGTRQGRSRLSKSSELHSRLREHSRSINNAGNLKLADFSCRLMILNNEMSDIIATVESALIRKYRPLWNSIIDGFGNHDPGKGRRNQSISEWDTLHPGRPWVSLMTGPKPDLDIILKKIRKYESVIS